MKNRFLTAASKNTLPILISIFYLLTHLWNLAKFPVFADEAIYIRWAQLLIDDWQRYLFFPLNDGKTPLFIWLLAPFQFLFSNQLVAGRILGVLVGLIQLWVIKRVLQQLGANSKFQALGMALTTILPFWFFYHRVALMDGMLALLISITVMGILELTQNPLKKFSDLLTKKNLFWIGFTGVQFGLALWTKLPALFALPSLFIFALLPAKRTAKQTFWLAESISVALFIGLVIFATLRVSPAFGQLFHRSQDFTYSIKEIVIDQKWKQTLPSIPNYFNIFWQYLSWPIILLMAAGIFAKKRQRQNLIFLAAGILFCGPFVLLGKVVYARYLLPAAFFFIITAVLSSEAFYKQFFVEAPAKNPSKEVLIKFVVGLVIATFAARIALVSVIFDLTTVLQPDATPFVSADRTQYLEDWSSGHGTAETAALIRQLASQHSVAIATEGRFGSLPDGLLLYFHRRDTHNIYIEGTGQYPVKSLPDFFTARAKSFDQSLLVVNSNRMELSLPPTALIAEFCRPNNAPCLQVWDVTSQVKNAVPTAATTMTAPTTR